MSPVVGNFVHDLVEMAKAMETLPQVEQERALLQAKLDEATDVIAAREISILSYKHQIEDLQAKVRSLEVERDDASFRVLEAEDEAHAVVAQARAAAAALGSIIDKLDPPKPVVVPEPVPVPAPDPTPAPTQGQSEANPTPETSSAPSLMASDGSVSPATGVASEAPAVHWWDHPATPTETPVAASQPVPDPIQPAPVDAEPSNKYSYEWYQWNDRRNRSAAG